MDQPFARAPDRPRHLGQNIVTTPTHITANEHHAGARRLRGKAMEMLEHAVFSCYA
jgi:hypothetical protein